MKDLFITTYWVQFESDRNSKHDRFHKFWIWNKPCFYYWILSIRKETEINTKCNLVVVNCGKI